MAVNCYVSLGATLMYPELPVGIETIAISEDKRMLNGQLRRAWRATKVRYTLTLRDASEAERLAWVAAANMSAAATFVTELGASISVLVMSVTQDLSRTVPTVDGGLSTTGPGFYDLTVVLEEV